LDSYELGEVDNISVEVADDVGDGIKVRPDGLVGPGAAGAGTLGASGTRLTSIVEQPLGVVVCHLRSAIVGQSQRHPSAWHAGALMNRESFVHAVSMGRGDDPRASMARQHTRAPSTQPASST